MAHYNIFREQLAIKYPAYGHALWEPNPGKLYGAVEVGDVGYIREGKFHRLFNALLDAEHPSHQRFGVPEYHEPLRPNVLEHIDSGILSPNDFHSAGVTVDAGGLDQFASEPEGSAQVLFSCNRKRGAVLSLPVQAQRRDTIARGAFGRWMVKHIDRWFAFTKQLGLGIDQMEDIIMVTGCHRTRSWTNVAFLESQADAQVSFGVEVAGNLGNRITWQFSRKQTQGAVLNRGPDGKDLAEDQCIFIRGFRVARLFRILPRQLRGAAENAPDPDGYDCEPDTELISIPPVTKYRDPLLLLLDYISERAPGCDMVLVHDDDLERIEGIGGDTSLETIQPNTVLDYFQMSNTEIYKVVWDLSPGNNSLNTGTQIVTVATLSISQELNPTLQSLPLFLTSENTSSHCTSNSLVVVPQTAQDGQDDPLMSHTRSEMSERQSASAFSLPVGRTHLENMSTGPAANDMNTLEGSHINGSFDGLQRTSSATIRAPGMTQISSSNFSLNPGKFAQVKRHKLISAVLVACTLLSFLGWMRMFTWDVISVLFFTLVSGSFALSVWFHRERTHHEQTHHERTYHLLNEMYGKMEALQHSVESLESSISRKPVVPAVVQGGFPVMTREVPARRDMVEQSVQTSEQMATFEPDGHCGPLVNIHGIPTLVPQALPKPDEHVDPQRHTDNTAEPSHIGFTGDTTGQQKGPSSPVQDPSFSRWSPVLLEMKQQIERFTEGRLQRMSHLDQREPPNFVSLRRIGVRLLMSCASFSPADFASPISYLGAPQTTLYYPTGNIQRDRIVAFTTAMDCLDDLEFYIRGNDDAKIAGKLPELAQALSDLGLHEYALTTCSFALEILEGRHAAARDTSHLDLASVLSLQANILCDLKRKDESVEAAEKAVVLCREYRDSQVDPVPEVAYALVNYAVLLCSFGLMDEGNATAFELLGEVDNDSRPDMKHISSLCRLCLSITRIEDDNEMALSIAEEAIELSRGSSDADSQAVLACALLTKSKILSSKGQDVAACPVSAEATTVLRTLSVGRSLFSLFLAHALDTHAHHLSEANRKPESYSTLQDAVELWQILKISAPGPIARPLAWCLFHLAKFRQKGANRNVLNEELRIAKTAITVFREVSPLDAPGLGSALYLYADRMFELDKNRTAAKYAEESVYYFREARLEKSGKEKYALDLIFSLSMASSCLACTERANDALEYAKQAVEVQHERKDTGDGQYDSHLRKLLMDVIFRSTEMDRQEEALPWTQELNRLGDPKNMLGDGKPLLGRSGNQPQGRNERDIRKETSYWLEPSTVGNRPVGSPSKH